MIKYQKYFMENTTVNIKLPKEIADVIQQDVTYDNIDISFKLQNSNSPNEDLTISFDPVNYLGYLQYNDSTGKCHYKDLFDSSKCEVESLEDYKDLGCLIESLCSLMLSESIDCYRNEKRILEDTGKISPENNE